MTQARSQLILPDTAGTYQCVQRCVRRALLCDIDHDGFFIRLKNKKHREMAMLFWDIEQWR